LPDDAIAGTILVVDDDPTVCNALRRVLTRNGYSVETAADGTEARAALAVGDFDVVVSDVVMPGLNGLDLLRAVRERDLDVPVVLLTGEPDIANAAKAVEYGAFRYLIKPISGPDLADVVRAASRLHRLARVRREAFGLVGQGRHSLGDRAGLEARFVKALETLWMAYQPVVSSGTQGVFGYEALARTGEPTLQDPLDLFHAAERLGRQRELGRAVRARVAADAARAPEFVALFVNIGVDDLNDPELFGATAPLSALAGRVILEVTERSSIEQVSAPLERAKKLRHLGYRLGLDDLGAGYAGLSCFTLLQPDVVKLDPSLIRDIHGSSQKQSIVRSLMHLAARDLNMLVVCEGVETPAERTALLYLGADLMQGYLFGRPAREFVPPVW
jgi:EAL domain-containing protein (putative c-di-GMP-specific phosphodiesterase class I)/ActR/RegA family two-component response regulator